MAAERIAHRGEHTVSELGFSTRGETVEERRGEDRNGDALLDRGLQGPAALAGVADAAGVVLEHRRLVQRLRGEVEEPGGDHRPPAPELRDRGEVELVTVVVRVAQGRGLGVGLLVVQPHVRVLEHVQALGVRLHDPVLDPVVDHLHEVPGPGRAAVEPALLFRRRVAFAAWRPGRRLDSGSQRLEHRREATDSLILAADHQAVAAAKAPDSTAHADVHEMDAVLSQLGGTAQVVHVVRVAAVDHRVAGFEVRREL